MKERIGPKDSILDIVIKMSEGNPGAMTVITEIIKKGATIDPQCFLGGVGGVLLLDTHGIYGSRIWMLYSDVCGRDIVKTLAMLRACQLGLISNATLRGAIDNRGFGVDVDKTTVNVKDLLAEFDRQS